MIGEERQSDTLAKWLETAATGELADPPLDVDPDVIEAVYALWPDRAPAPRVTIEDILGHIDQGPALAAFIDGEGDGDGLDADVREAVFALHPERAPAPTTRIDEILAHADQADALAAIADGTGDGTVDDDVREGLYAIKPDRAPAPTVSIFDILAKVNDGPLAQAPAPHEAEVIPFPQSAAEPVTARPTPVRRGWGRVLAGSGAFGLLAAAAVASIVVMTHLPEVGAPPPDAVQSFVPVDHPVGGPVAVDGSGTDATKFTPPASIPETPGLEDVAAATPETTAHVAPPEPARPDPTTALKVPATERYRAEDDAVVDGFGDVGGTLSTKDSQWSNASGRSGSGTGAGDGLFGGAPVEAPPPPPAVAPGADAQGYWGTVQAEETRDARRETKPARATASNMSQATPAPAAAPADGPALAKAPAKEKAETHAPAPSSPASAGVSMDDAESDAAMTAPATTGATATIASTSASNAFSPTAPGLEGASASTIDRLGRLEGQARALAASGKYADAARKLSAAVATPKEAGQYYAAIASGWYLDAGDAVAAVAIAEKGAALGSPMRTDLALALANAQAAVDSAKQPAATTIDSQ